jgi:tetratricopeptide (TPR) repeat protein
VVDGDQKYIRQPRPELYDQLGDWSETSNLAGDRSGETERLSGILDAFQASPPAAPSLQIDSETAQKLAALGYVEGVDGWSDSTSSIDVKDRADVLKLILGAAAFADRFEGGESTPESEEAVDMLENAIEMEPTILESYMRLSRLYTKLNQPKQANEVLERALANWPDSVNLMLTIAVNAGSLGDFETVDRYARMVYDLNPSSVRALELLMSSLFMRGQSQAAIALGEEFMDRHPDSAVIAGFLGLQMAGKSEYETEDEIRQIQRYLRLGLEAQFPRQGIRHALAMMALAAGVDEDVVRLTRDELRDYPASLRTRRLLLRVLGEQKRYAEQLPHWEYLRKQAPQSLELIHSHAQALWNAKQHERSKALVLEGLSRDSEHPNLLMLQANHLSRDGQDEEAQQTYQRALAAKKARESGTSTAP